MRIQPCTGCGFCADRVSCIFNDDMTAAYRSLVDADIVSISSPLYFSSLTGSLKCFIDRCQVFWELQKRSREPQKKKYGFFISVGGGDYPRMFEPSITVVRHYFNTLGCVFNEEDYLMYGRLDKGDQVPQDLIDNAVAAGQRFINSVQGSTI